MEPNQTVGAAESTGGGVEGVAAAEGVLKDLEVLAELVLAAVLT